jgi:hypothetical protein
LTVEIALIEKKLVIVLQAVDGDAEAPLFQLIDERVGGPALAVKIEV